MGRNPRDLSKITYAKYFLLLLSYLMIYSTFPSRIYVHEFVQSLYIRACNTQYAIIIIIISNPFSRIHWWLRKSRSLKAGRRVSVAIHDGLSSSILSSSLSFPHVYARLPRLSSYSCGSSANWWIRYIAFVSSLSVPKFNDWVHSAGRTIVQQLNVIDMYS